MSHADRDLPDPRAVRRAFGRAAATYDAAAVLQREIPVEQAIAQLHDLAPEELVLFLSRRDLLAIDRVARVLNAVPVRWLPLVRRLAGTRRAGSPELLLDVLGGLHQHALVDGVEAVDDIVTDIVSPADVEEIGAPRLGHERQGVVHDLFVVAPGCGHRRSRPLSTLS